MATAVLVDGGFFVKRFRRIEPHNAYNAQRAADLVCRWAAAHLAQGGERRQLYRIFFYDCPPLTKKLFDFLAKKTIDFSRSDEAVFRNALHAELRRRRKVALRLGHLSDSASWAVAPELLQDILKGKVPVGSLTSDDLVLNVRQKGVDMRIGIDISSLALKRQVDQIVLVAGDADFVPAAKLARREGIDFILDPLWATVPSGLSEHIDGMRTVCPKPKPKATAAATAPAGPEAPRPMAAPSAQAPAPGA